MVSNAYADAAPNLVKTAANATRISKTLVDEQHNLDALLISAIGLADIGNDVLSTNREPLTNVMHLLVPTTDLTNEYHEVFTCGFGGLDKHTRTVRRCRNRASTSRQASPGAPNAIGIRRTCPRLRRRAARSAWVCRSCRSTRHPPQLITDIGADPVVYGNPQLLINSDLLKQLLYGPIAGPPRNSAQVGQPG